MNKKLGWQEIEALYDKQWVQLIDYDWPEEEALPRSGVVHVHAKSRKEFDKLILENIPADAAIVFVGEMEIPPNVIYSFNLNQWRMTSS